MSDYDTLREQVRALADMGVREMWTPDDWRVGLLTALATAPASEVREPSRCNCATWGSARLCPVHTQADFAAADLNRATEVRDDGAAEPFAFKHDDFETWTDSASDDEGGA